MKYDVEYSKTAMNTIKKMDSSTSNLIRTWIEKNLMNTENSRIKGKALNKRTGINRRFKRIVAL